MAAANTATPQPGSEPKVTIGIGSLCTYDESFRVSIAVLVATLAGRVEQRVSANAASVETPKWYKKLLRTVVVECLQLDVRIYESVAPIGCSYDGGDLSHVVEPLVEQWELASRVRVVSEILVYQLLRHNGYDSRVRATLNLLREELKVSLEVFLDIEAKASDFLTNAEDLKQMLESDQAANLTKQLAEQDEVDVDKVESAEQTRRDRMRLAKISAAALTGGILIGVTGGLAAPAIGAGLTAIGGTLGFGGLTAGIGGFLTTTGGTIFATSLFGATGAGLNGYKMSRRLGYRLKEFFFHEQEDANKSSLSLLIGINGWQTSKDDVHYIWPVGEGQSLDCKYLLVWERQVLQDLGQAFRNIAVDNAVNLAMTETLKHTTLAALVAAVAWPTTLLSAGKLIDNPWHVALNRAELAGEELASVLMARKHGMRPVSLYGYSVGALVIFKCLEKLARADSSSKPGKGIVENVYLVGACVSTKESNWRNVRSVVAGRFVNCYSPKDWILSFLSRASGETKAVAGLSAISLSGIENLDLSTDMKVVHHFEYATPELHQLIAHKLGIFPVDPEVQAPKADEEDDNMYVVA